ncbi:hypothetical protein C1N71_03175 [Agrococcus sp. SGAir0287]|nr:hypothetical protein C1N71_03175 [Agrococcus sp. SGAir0287]
MISDRLGIDDGETLSTLRDFDAVFEAIASTSWEHPEIGHALAASLAEQGRDDLAGPLAEHADRAEAAARPLTATAERAPLAAITA